MSGVIQGAVAHDHMTVHKPSIHFIPEPAFYLASGKTSQRPTSLNKHCMAGHTLKIVELNYKPILNRTPKIILQTTVLKKTLLFEINRFTALSRTSSHVPGLSSPGKCHNKIPGLLQVFPDLYEPCINETSLLKEVFETGGSLHKEVNNIIFAMIFQIST